MADLLREETGIDPRLDEFLALCRQYLLPGAEGRPEGNPTNKETPP